MKSRQPGGPGTVVVVVVGGGGDGGVDVGAADVDEDLAGLHPGGKSRRTHVHT